MVDERGGRGRGRGRGGGIAIQGIAEIDAELGGSGGGGLKRGRNEAAHHPSKDSSAAAAPQGDWFCSSADCGNKNWGWRKQCNKCGQSRPGLVEGERDGAGGGFSEIQSRASRAEVEVGDDGFDDFGRKKARVKADRKAKEAAALARLRSSYGGVSSILGDSLQSGVDAVDGQFDDADAADAAARDEALMEKRKHGYLPPPSPEQQEAFQKSDLSHAGNGGGRDQSQNSNTNRPRPNTDRNGSRRKYI